VPPYEPLPHLPSYDSLELDLHEYVATTLQPHKGPEADTIDRDLETAKHLVVAQAPVPTPKTSSATLDPANHGVHTVDVGDDYGFDVPGLCSKARTFIRDDVYNLFAILLAGGAFVNARIPPQYAGLGEI
ncbi:hypothetical protein LTR95_019127, partial [Oleoguttula sp. CCFEE 5521]